MASPWQNTAEILVRIGISRSHLYKLRRDGTLKQGMHWRDIRSQDAKRPTYQWHCKALEKLLNTASAKRG